MITHYSCQHGCKLVPFGMALALLLNSFLADDGTVGGKIVPGMIMLSGKTTAQAMLFETASCVVSAVIE